MNTLELKAICVLGAGLVLAAAPLVAASAASLCDMPQLGPDARACAAEAQGPTELRRFVTRTRAIYGLYDGDYARPAPAAAAAPAADAAQVASAPAETRRAAMAK